MQAQEMILGQDGRVDFGAEFLVGGEGGEGGHGRRMMEEGRCKKGMIDRRWELTADR